MSQSDEFVILKVFLMREEGRGWISRDSYLLMSLRLGL